MWICQRCQPAKRSSWLWRQVRMARKFQANGDRLNLFLDQPLYDALVCRDCIITSDCRRWSSLAEGAMTRKINAPAPTQLLARMQPAVGSPVNQRLVSSAGLGAGHVNSRQLVGRPCHGMRRATFRPWISLLPFCSFSLVSSWRWLHWGSGDGCAEALSAPRPIPNLEPLL